MVSWPVKCAKRLMRAFPAQPDFSEKRIGELSEVFSHPVFLKADNDTKKEIMLGSAQAKYESEKKYPWDAYFNYDISGFLRGKTVLDLGCFTGGRGAAWAKRYDIKHLVGLDVKPEFIQAAQLFMEQKHISAQYHVAIAEKMPFKENAFDAIVTFDVFEHVENLSKTLDECYRVLKPGGYLLSVFPGYYHPIEHHLSLATRLPGIHYLFSPKTLIQAYYEIIDERGEEGKWYQRSSSSLCDWERGNRINGTTLRQFRRMLKERPWVTTWRAKLALGSVGRRVSKKRRWRYVSYFLAPFACLPITEEIALHRITYILQKP